MPSFQDLEDAVGALETYVAATIQRLTDDLRRYGPPEMPQLPQIPHIPLFASIPPPPPPPPPIPPQTVTSWIEKQRPLLIGAACVAGVGLVAAGGWMYWSRRRVGSQQAQGKGKFGKNVVVVLAADSPLGQLVVGELCRCDHIVIASVSTPETVVEVERSGKGYVKGLVLDPTDPSSTTPFLRSLQSTLSLKFPIAPGDPYAPCPPSELPTLVSLVSLLSLTASPTPTHNELQASQSSTTSTISQSAPSLATLSISKDYLPHLITTHLTPLSIIQSVLPLFRASKRKGQHSSIVVVLRGGAESTGLVGHQAATAMSNAAMAKGCEILRREVSLAPEVAGLRVVMIDVGELAIKPRASRSPRRPTDPARLTDAILRIIGASPVDLQTPSGPFGTWMPWTMLSIRDWWRGDRFSIGAGAGTYSLANQLPLWILDTLILVPHRLLAYQDWVKNKTRNIRHEVAKERRRRKERERQERLQAELEANEGKAMIIVPKAPRSTASTHSAEDEPSVPADSDHDSDSGVDSSPASEPGDHQHIGESWVMDVDSHHEAEATATA